MGNLEKLEKLSWRSKISFGIGAFGKDLVYALVGNLFMFYLTDVRFVAPVFVGTLFMVARIWDAFNDPFMGMIVDNTRSKWGKFRPWIMIGTVLNAIVLALMFWNVDFEGNVFLAFCSVLYILWGMTYTIDDIPYWSMVPALTDDENERSQVSAIPRLFASFAWLIVGSFGLKIIDTTGGGDRRVGFAYFAMMVSIIFIVCSAITVINCKEKIVTKSSEKTTVKGMIHVLVANDQVKVILGIAMFFTEAPLPTTNLPFAASQLNALPVPFSVHVLDLIFLTVMLLNVALFSISDCGASTIRSTLLYVPVGIVKFTAPAGLIVIFVMPLLANASVNSCCVVTVASVCVVVPGSTGAGVVVTTFALHLRVFVLFFFLLVVASFTLIVALPSDLPLSITELVVLP